MNKKTQSSLKNILHLSILISILSVNVASAHIWCNDGTVVQIADVTWNESSIITNYPGLIPGDIPPWVVGNVDMHITYEAIRNYADTFVGGGGGFGGYSVPNSGEVVEDAYWPHNYITAPSLYHISQGVKFRLKKCYTIAPMTAVKDLEMIALPGGTVPGETSHDFISRLKVTPLYGLERMMDYWNNSNDNR